MSGESDRGRFVWYDLMTTDPEGAQAFYTAVAGWGTEVWENSGMSYTMWTAHGKPMGGSMQLPAEAVAGGARPHWLAYVDVPDADAAAARARELGGQVMVPPRDIPTVGRFAVLADPQGAVIAAFTPERRQPQPEGAPALGEFSWHELATTDPEGAWAFYSDLFGWEKEAAHDMGPMGIYQLYGRHGKQLGGLFRKPAEMPGPSAWLYYARVADVHAAIEAAREQGGQLMMGPHEVPGGDLIATFLDPQGGMFAVHEARSAA